VSNIDATVPSAVKDSNRPPLLYPYKIFSFRLKLKN